jgi:predicted CxxxxCH...CXXCH cytochrome family protein
VGSGSVSDLVLACGQCHVVPVSVYAPGHLDSDLPAEVVISGGLAGPKPKDQFDVPEYDAGTTTCGNTFCHGAWSLSKASAPAFAQFAYTQDVMNGSNDSPTWTGGGDEIECGTCHGLPPDGHVSADLDDCGFCHSGTVSPEGMIVDVKLHMNGKVNTIFAPERPF